MKTPEPTIMYDLIYLVNGKVREIIQQNKPKPIIAALKRRLHIEGNYNYGLLIIKRTYCIRN